MTLTKRGLRLIALVASGAAGFAVWTIATRSSDTYTTEKTEYHAPSDQHEDPLQDDRLADKVTTFDADLVDRRPWGGWLVNKSNAVIKLDVPLIKPDVSRHLLKLHRSYSAAYNALKSGQFLPSVNMIDGKAKQFDDGLYAALDQAYYTGLDEALASHVGLVRRLHAKVGPNSPATPFLAAALELAGETVAVNDVAAKDRALDQFLRIDVRSKPIGFYTWNETLRETFRFLRFLQESFGTDDLDVPAALAAALASDASLLADYQRAVDFFARLTNPYKTLSLVDLTEMESPDAAGIAKRCRERQLSTCVVAFFPASTSRETELFEKLFPNGLPENVDLMGALIRAIRSGRVDLTPRSDGGWYDYQVYALETLLLPEKSSEHNKLLLTKAYKKRMLEAFKALVTKRRETHVRGLTFTEITSALPERPPLPPMKPRLRVEPAPSYFVRTARAYSFLSNFLESAVGVEPLKTLHGLTATGPRTVDLASELQYMRELFYGLYIISAEDIGMRASFFDDEQVDVEHCTAVAAVWIASAWDDPDLGSDVRVAVPISFDPTRRVTRFWITLGVRATRLEANYARTLHVKPMNGSGTWERVEPSNLEPAHHLILVDEFAEVEMNGLVAMTREELRTICDRAGSKEAIIAALGNADSRSRGRRP